MGSDPRCIDDLTRLDKEVARSGDWPVFSCGRRSSGCPLLLQCPHALVPSELLRLSHKVFEEDGAKMTERSAASPLCGISSTKDFFNRLYTHTAFSQAHAPNKSVNHLTSWVGLHYR